MSGCDFCDIRLVDKRCLARDDRRFVCTRVVGHYGPHVACSVSRHEIRTWEAS